MNYSEFYLNCWMDYHDYENICQSLAHKFDFWAQSSIPLKPHHQRSDTNDVNTFLMFHPGHPQYVVMIVQQQCITVISLE
jgi:hypothetical protein